MKNKRNKVVAVVVTYNRKNLLKECIAKLLEQENASCDIWLIDNASTDGTKEMVENLYLLPQLKYINTGSNLGGAGGFEYGVKKAVEAGYEYVWIMDDDTLPEKTALYELFEADKKLHGDWGFLSSVAYWTDGTVCKANRQKKTIFRFVNDKDYGKDMVQIEMGSFVSLLVKSKVIKEVGLPISEYFIWTDDYEFCSRISRKYKGFMVTKSRVAHIMKNHSKANFAIDDMKRAERYYCLFRNDVHCYRQYGIQGWAYILLKDLYSILNIIFHAKTNKLERIKVIVKGFMSGLMFKPCIGQVDKIGGGILRVFYVSNLRNEVAA